MKKYLLLPMLSLVVFAGCSGKPSTGAAKDYLAKEIAAKYGEAAEVASFKKTNATEGELAGVKFYDMDYEYGLSCKKALPIEELSKVPVETVVQLDEFFQGQTGPWEKIDFDKMPKAPLSGAGIRVLLDAYTQKKSLLACKAGETMKRTGGVRFVLRENGWEVLDL